MAGSHAVGVSVALGIVCLWFRYIAVASFSDALCDVDSVGDAGLDELTACNIDAAGYAIGCTSGSDVRSDVYVEWIDVCWCVDERWFRDVFFTVSWISFAGCECEVV